MIAFVYNHIGAFATLWFLLSIVASMIPTPDANAPQWKRAIYTVAHLISGSWGRLAPMLAKRFPQIAVLVSIMDVLQGKPISEPHLNAQPNAKNGDSGAPGTPKDPSQASGGSERPAGANGAAVGGGN